MQGKDRMARDVSVIAGSTRLRNAIPDMYKIAYDIKIPFVIVLGIDCMWSK